MRWALPVFRSNSYILFMKERSPVVMAKLGTKNMIEGSQMVAEIWRGMSDAEKQVHDTHTHARAHHTRAHTHTHTLVQGGL